MTWDYPGFPKFLMTDKIVLTPNKTVVGGSLLSLGKKHFLLRNRRSAQEGFVGKQVHESVPTFLFLVVLRKKKNGSRDN